MAVVAASKKKKEGNACWEYTFSCMKSCQVGHFPRRLRGEAVKHLNRWPGVVGLNGWVQLCV